MPATWIPIVEHEDHVIDLHLSKFHLWLRTPLGQFGSGNYPR